MREGERDRPRDGRCDGPRDERCDRPRPPREEPEPEGDHAEQTARLWQEAFYQALHEVRVDILKEKIKASWGKGMEPTADAVVSAMHAEWKKFQEEEAKKQQDAESSVEAIARRIKEGWKEGPQ